MSTGKVGHVRADSSTTKGPGNLGFIMTHFEKFIYLLMKCHWYASIAHFSTDVVVKAPKHDKTC
jgi:hypothetical protein